MLPAPKAEAGTDRNARKMAQDRKNPKEGEKDDILRNESSIDWYLLYLLCLWGQNDSLADLRVVVWWGRERECQISWCHVPKSGADNYV